MGRKKTTEEFIVDAWCKHGDRYNYSLVEYTNNRTKVKIICKEHGMFEQTPYCHVNREQKCSKCAREAQIGEGNPFYGKKHSKESLKLMSTSSIGKSKGSKNGNYNKPMSEVVKRKMILTKKRRSNTGFAGGSQYVYYDRFLSKLSPYESCRRNKDNLNILEVKCYHCNEFYVPNRMQVSNRIQTIKGNKDNRLFYCSDGCRSNCPVYGKHWTTFIDIHETTSNDREVQPQLRELVFERDGYQCVKCGDKGYLNCHHIDPVKSNPIESADVDNCMTLCIDCHKEVHQIDGCKTGQLANC